MSAKESLDLSLDQDKVWFDVSAYSVGYMAVTGTGTWATAIVTAKFSIVKDQSKLTTFSSSPVFTNSDGMQPLDVDGRGLKGIRYVAAVVTTADGSDDRATPVLYAEQYDKGSDNGNLRT
jgi:hypothetical protein